MYRFFLLIIFAFVAQASFAQTDFYQKLANAAHLLTEQKVSYDSSYYALDYPNGDIPSDKGVCTDVIIRAYRKLGIDLQKEVHEDMQANFHFYPKKWGLKTTDKNIDHRRVLNLMVFFTRNGQKLNALLDSKSYLPGDIVAWDLGGDIPHIGIVSNKKSTDDTRYKIVHNIGAGQVLEDMLFDYKIIGHYRYNPLPQKDSINYK